MSRTIFFSQTPDPAQLQETGEMEITLHDNGQITGELTKNTMEMLDFLRKTAGIDHQPVIDFCG